MAEEVQRLKFPAISLAQTSKGDARKVQIARRLREETTVSLRWIAEHLQMGSVPYLAKMLTMG